MGWMDEADAAIVREARAANQQKEVEDAAMKERVRKQMLAAMDTGVRRNLLVEQMYGSGASAPAPAPAPQDEGTSRADRFTSAREAEKATGKGS